MDADGQPLEVHIPKNFPVIMGGKTIGEATYMGDGLASVSIDDKFAKRFLTGSNIHISIATPDN